MKRLTYEEYLDILLRVLPLLRDLDESDALKVSDAIRGTVLRSMDAKDLGSFTQMMDYAQEVISREKGLPEPASQKSTERSH